MYKAIDDLRTDLKALLRSSPREPASDELDDPAALGDPLSSDALRTEDTRYIEVRQLAAAAGVGSTVFDETMTDCIPFRRRWLSHHGIDPVKCSVIGVRGESMEPTLPDGCSILVDHSQLQRRVGCIFVVRTAEGLVVKRLGRAKGNWYLESDHPAWPSVAWTEDTEMIGKVRWMATTL
ncbi:MAG: S24 family peptidase [Gemmatimonadota bacterium]|nr:S24 family peptidase [Gemmatimonadota bacterium]